MNQMHRAIAASQFVVEALLELWMGLQPLSSERNIQIDQLCNSYQLDCIVVFVKHIISLNLSTINSDSNQRMRMEMRMNEDVFETSKTTAYRLLRPKLYTYLRHAFESWPRDDGFYTVADVWIAYITPWTAFGNSFTSEWNGFVQDNFLFYTRLLYDFILRFNSIDIYSSARSPPNSSSALHLSKLEMVMNVFSDSKLIDFIRVLETALISLDSYAAHEIKVSTQEAQRTSTISLFGPTTPRSKSFGGDRIETFQNSGPRTRSDIIALEGSFVYKPLFMVKSGQSEVRVLVFFK